jgi:single-stranded DNA-binding protein
METFKNQVILKGTLQGKPEWRIMPAQKKMLSFNLLTHPWLNLPVQVPQVHRVVAWDELAEEADRVLRSGASAIVEGALVTRTILDENGNFRTAIEIRLKGIRSGNAQNLKKAG